MKDVTSLFSRYRPRFVRSLIYMLQASEYDIREYLRWYHRTSDFAHVEKRKTLVWTAKVKVLFAISWIVIIVWAVGLMWYAGSTGSDVPIVVLAGVVFLLPFYFPYMLAALAWIVQLLQRPIENSIVAKAKQTLTTHQGFKIAIAGSYGKTSMREILRTVLSEGKKVAAPPGSHNTPLGIAKFISTLSGDENVLIFELGEYYPGDIRKLCEFVQPDLGIITGVNEAHLEKFGTLERAADTIFELSAFVAPENLYINGENELASARAEGRNVVYSRAGAGRFAVGHTKTGLDGTSFSLVLDDDSRIDARSHLLGLHQIGPLVAAADIAAKLKLDLKQIVSGISKTAAFEHRLQKRVDATGVVTLDDSYNGNPDGAKAVIEFLASLKGHRRFYVTPGLVEAGARKQMVHAKIGEELARAGIEKVVLVKTSVTPFIEQSLRKAGFHGEVLKFDDMPKALEALQHMTVSGDVVLIQNDWPDQYA
ncbi:MAG TPA: UDP-N-acetylmuramoyl-tripeptide--D-alanyl-D-alanine ligase [Candidatus Paceibacterota bacterium]|nr:UDP-N-acetylmuramoyl-tripeptide--D-alanyl-D-alanine ligase [Candidatus Paceibacterota bacterium]